VRPQRPLTLAEAVGIAELPFDASGFTSSATANRSHMRRVISKDGTSIAYEAVGTGPAVVLVGGGLDDGSENAPLAGELARSFTVYNYARRGRGDSGDTPPYALEREIEDIEALLVEAGGTAHLYGVSTGGALVLEAAAASVVADKLAVYEVPYNTAGDWPPRWQRYVERLGAALADGRRGDALELFMQLTGSSEAEIAGARSSPFWPAMERLAHTLAYDAACLGDGRPPTDRFAGTTQPSLVATGAAARDPGAPAWVLALYPAADAIAASIPHSERRTVEGQSHMADPKVVAPVLEQFFGA
jgi:Alpha/beta hydrolase family